MMNTLNCLSTQAQPEASIIFQEQWDMSKITALYTLVQQYLQNFVMPSPKSTSIASVAFSWKNSLINSSHHIFWSDSGTWEQ